MELSLFFERVGRWGIKGGLSILDQGLYSGANFVLTILLARWLAAKEFGQFAMGFAVLTVIMQIYTSFVLEPIGVLGPSNYGSRLASYLKSQVYLLFALSVPFVALLGAVVLLWQYLAMKPLISLTLIFAVLGFPLVLFPLLMRRIFYILQKPGIALVGSLVYFAGTLGGIMIMNRFNLLSGRGGMMVILLAGLCSGCMLLYFLRKSTTDSDQMDLKIVLIETWTFGRWLILSGFLIALATQAQVYLAGVLSSPEDAGAVRVLQTFIQPIMLAFTAFSALVTPIISADYSSGNYPSMRRKIFQFTILLGTFSIVYEILLVLYGTSAAYALFGEKYELPGSLIAVWGGVPVILSFFWGGVIALQTSKKPYAMLIISIFWGGVSFVLALLFIPDWGVWGATASITGGFIAGLIATWILYWTWVDREILLATRSLQ